MSGGQHACLGFVFTNWMVGSVLLMVGTANKDWFLLIDGLACWGMCFAAGASYPKE